MELDNDTTNLLKAINLANYDMRRGEEITVSIDDLMELKKIIEAQKEENDSLLKKVDSLTDRNRMLTISLGLEKAKKKSIETYKLDARV